MLVLSFLFLGGCIATTSVSITSTASNGALEPIPAALFKPDGQGPFPAVVIMHDCSGRASLKRSPRALGKGTNGTGIRHPDPR
jgi:hypothetical protein